jgi:nucleotide-binding universal stress UspA family protein
MIDGHHVIAAGDPGVPWSTSTEVVPAHMRLAMKHRMTKLDVRALKRLVSGTADHALVFLSVPPSLSLFISISHFLLPFSFSISSHLSLCLSPSYIPSPGFASSLPLYRKILLAYDGTAESALALREGAELARLSGARAYLYAVLNLAPTLMGVEGMGGGDLISSELERFKAILKEGVRYLRDRGVEAEGHLVQGLPPDEIVRAAQSFGADLVILGYHRRKGFAKWWHTPTSSQILDRLPCSLLVAITQASEATEPAGESTS